MKKAVATTLCVILLCLGGCSGGTGETPANTSDRMYELGLAALETADDFLDTKITANVAHERLDSASTSARFQTEADKKEAGSNHLIGTEYSNDEFIYNKILSLEISVSSKNYGTGTDASITEARNDLAALLNEKSR